MNKMILALAALALPATANAAPFINGSFETGPSTGVFVGLTAGSTAINGWVVGGAGIDYIGTYWNASNGARSIDLSGNGPGSISQTFDTIVGALYNVTFDLAGNGDGGPGQKTATVLASGGTLGTFSTPSSPKPNLTYTPYTYTFTATGSATTLTFASATNTAFGPVLDNVSVTAAVPEPATWAMMMLGFGAMGSVLRRRKRSVFATA